MLRQTFQMIVRKKWNWVKTKKSVSKRNEGKNRRRETIRKRKKKKRGEMYIFKGIIVKKVSEKKGRKKKEWESWVLKDVRGGGREKEKGPGRENGRETKNRERERWTKRREMVERDQAERNGKGGSGRRKWWREIRQIGKRWGTNRQTREGERIIMRKKKTKKLNKE